MNRIRTTAPNPFVLMQQLLSKQSMTQNTHNTTHNTVKNEADSWAKELN